MTDQRPLRHMDSLAASSSSHSSVIGLPLEEESPVIHRNHPQTPESLGQEGVPSNEQTPSRSNNGTAMSPSILSRQRKTAFAQPSNDSSDNGPSLQDRVDELETKLAVLSMLLQRVTTKDGGSNVNGSNKITGGTPPMHLADRLLASVETSVDTPPRVWLGSDNDDEAAYSTASKTSSVPHLESPAPFSWGGRPPASLSPLASNGRAARTPSSTDIEPEDEPPTPPRNNGSGSYLRNETPLTSGDEDDARMAPPPSSAKHNFSFKLLYQDEGNEDEYLKAKNQTAPPTLQSLTLAERSWLRPAILKFNQQRQRDEAVAEAQRQAQYAAAAEDPARSKWLNYLNSFQESTPDVDLQMEEFIQVPGQVEHIMGFGIFICVDSFLYMITVLPIRFVWSCFLLLLTFVWKKPSPSHQFHRQHMYQIIQVALLWSIYLFLSEISIGKLYHWIRGQSMIKLYVLIAITEVFDRLFCSLGQDCLDSMYWNTVSRPRSSRMLISVVVVFVYATIHTLLLFVHVETLNVAMNSADQALLTLLISGNFAEIKSTVFKKYNKPALFKITASDICERFKLSLFLSLVLLLNMCQGMDASMFYDYLRVCGYILGAELLADWIKHSFITKFNFLPAKVYPEYALLLAGDVAGIGHEGVNLDYSHAVTKRIGLAQIPLVCVMFRLLREAAKYASVRYTVPPVYLRMGGLIVWVFLLATKMALGSMLQRIALAKLHSAPEVLQTPMAKNKKNQ